jgi:hypothetical protein
MADVETTETEPPKKKKATRARVEIEGETTRTTVDDVIDTAGGRKGGGGSSTAAPQKVRFERAIRDPNNKIVAKRIAPVATLDGEPLGDEYNDLLPHDGMTRDEIKRDLTEARGGKKWHVRVEDADGRVVCAETVIVPGEPKLEPGFEESGGGGMGGEELETEETLEEQIARDPDIIRAEKDLRLLEIQKKREEREAELAEVKARRTAADRAAKGLPPISETTNGNGHKSEEAKFAEMIEKANAPLKAALAASEKALEEERARNRAREDKADRRAEQEALIAPLKAAQEQQAKTLEALLQKMNQPAAPTGPSIDTLMAKLDSMKTELRSDFTQQITNAISGIKDGLNSKIDTLASSVNVLMAKGNDPATNALIQLARERGGQGGPTTQDPFAILTRGLETMKTLQTMTGTTNNGPQDFPSYLVDKVTGLAPDIMEFIREQQQNAQVVTKEVLEAKMKELGGKMWQGLDQTIKTEIGKIRVVPQVATPTPAPASSAPAGPPPPSVKPTPAPAGVGAPPPPVSAAPGGAPPPPTPAPAPAGNVPPTAAYPFGMTKDDFVQTQKRVGHVLKILYGEMRLGVQAFKWPEQAFAHLPKPIIDALIPASTDVEIKNIIEPFAEPQVLQDIWAFLSDAHPQHDWYRKWLTDGINWIKDAAADQGSDEGGEPVVDEPE